MIHTKSGKVESDPEYQRYIRLVADARERGAAGGSVPWRRDGLGWSNGGTPEPA